MHLTFCANNCLGECVYFAYSRCASCAPWALFYTAIRYLHRCFIMRTLEFMKHERFYLKWFIQPCLPFNNLKCQRTHSGDLDIPIVKMLSPCHLARHVDGWVTWVLVRLSTIQSGHRISCLSLTGRFENLRMAKLSSSAERGCKVLYRSCINYSNESYF